MSFQHERNAVDAGNWREVTNEIVAELVEQRRVDRVRRTCQKEGVAVRCRTHRRLRADIAGGARPVLNNEWLAKPLRQPLPDYARDDVDLAARREWHDQAHGASGISLRPRETRQGRQRG